MTESGPAGTTATGAAAAVDEARAAAVEEATADMGVAAARTAVGEHLGVRPEGPDVVSHLFAADVPGYRGWHWSVTLAEVPDGPVTVSEVVLLPGGDALVAPVWVPWQERIRPGDLGPGDLLPVDPDDSRLVPAYLQSDDPAIEEVAVEVGLGRTRVLSREGRLDAAERWREAHGPSSDMARSAPGHCGTCGFFVSLAGSLRGGFGVCANEYTPADGAVVSVEFGCGAHSDVDSSVAGSPVHVSALVYDDGVDLEKVSPAAAEETGAPATGGVADAAPDGDDSTDVGAAPAAAADVADAPVPVVADEIADAPAGETAEVETALGGDPTVDGTAEVSADEVVAVDDVAADEVAVGEVAVGEGAAEVSAGGVEAGGVEAVGDSAEGAAAGSADRGVTS
ncbi:hypothetical protein GCM10009836_55630 [Pseudonocardia ailaonensis]|uniref:DUF3027 domain-containing protein n=1 Tax=Pseudonocardia ailaonensis TaxID=367279 RepID=A0ABN2NHD5_9PSEU